MKYFLSRVLRKVGLIRFVNLNWSIRLNGKSVSIPIVRGLGIANLAGGEAWLSTVVRPLLKVKAVVIDVGANVGQTLIKLKTMVPGVRYTGFEPNAVCVWYLEELIRSNGYEDCTIVPVGLSDASDILELSFFSRNEAEGSASLVSNFRPTTKVVNRRHVAVFRFDDIADKFDLAGLCLLKVDVEGAELGVLKGFEQTLRRYRPFIVLEILPAYSADNAGRVARQDELCDFLAGIDYALFRIIKSVDNGLQSLKPMDRIEIHADLNLCDYIAAPKESALELSRSFELMTE